MWLAGLLCCSFMHSHRLGCKRQTVQSSMALSILLHSIKLPNTISCANSARVSRLRSCLGSVPLVIPSHVFDLLFFLDCK